MSDCARIDGCLLLVSDLEANAGTRKTEKEKAGLQEKKYLVSINRAIAQARKETTVQLPRKQPDGTV
jgi:hypothetical protein